MQINYGFGAVIPEDNDDGDARHEKFETETERDRCLHSLEATKILTNRWFCLSPGAQKNV